MVVSLRSDGFRRLFALVVLALGTGAFVGEFDREPVGDLNIGSVAEHSIRASANFPFVDWEATLERQRSAEGRIKPVYDFDTTLSGRTRARIQESFEMARHRVDAAAAAPEDSDLSTLKADFLEILGLSLDDITMDRLLAQGFGGEVEKLTIDLVGTELGRFTIADK